MPHEARVNLPGERVSEGPDEPTVHQKSHIDKEQGVLSVSWTFCTGISRHGLDLQATCCGASPPSSRLSFA
jgi:hypothetical protein